MADMFTIGRTDVARPALPSVRGVLARLLARLLAADAAYRQRRRLSDAPAERLDDMGISRAEIARLGWRWTAKDGF
jgi:uncharacterized protein YjiS (DUF1127 family)